MGPRNRATKTFDFPYSTFVGGRNRDDYWRRLKKRKQRKHRDAHKATTNVQSVTHDVIGVGLHARAAFVAAQVERLVERSGVSELVAKQTVGRWCDSMLLPDVVLPLDGCDLADCTVGDVLADPERFAGETLADPLEGVEYGRCKAKIMRRPDGTPRIHSFAHGRSYYELKYDVSAVSKALEQTTDGDVMKTFIALVTRG